jgi:hypothetical protein
MIWIEAVGRKYSMSYLRDGKFLLAIIFACGLFAMASPARAQGRPQLSTRENEEQNNARQGRRLAAPSGLDCDRDHITSFTGRVLAYSRQAGQISIRVRTDEGTTENFTISYAQAQELLKRVKLNGQKLRQEELEKIEARWRREKRSVRVTVWACYDKDWRKPAAVLIDWQIGKPKPPETL